MVYNDIHLSNTWFKSVIRVYVVFIVFASLGLRPLNVNTIKTSIYTLITNISSTAFSFYQEFYIYSIVFQKPFYKNYPYLFFNNLENQTTFLLFLLKFKGSIPKSPHTASLQVFEEQPKIFLHAANNTASNALDWDVVHISSLHYHILMMVEEWTRLLVF